MNIVWNTIITITLSIIVVFFFFGFFFTETLNEFGRSREYPVVYLTAVVILGYLTVLGLHRRKSEEKKVTFEMAARTTFELGFLILAVVIVHQITGV